MVLEISLNTGGKRRNMRTKENNCLKQPYFFTTL